MKFPCISHGCEESFDTHEAMIMHFVNEHPDEYVSASLKKDMLENKKRQQQLAQTADLMKTINIKDVFDDVIPPGEDQIPFVLSSNACPIEGCDASFVNDYYTQVKQYTEHYAAFHAKDEREKELCRRTVSVAEQHLEMRRKRTKQTADLRKATSEALANVFDGTKPLVEPVLERLVSHVRLDTPVTVEEAPVMICFTIPNKQLLKEEAADTSMVDLSGKAIDSSDSEYSYMRYCLLDILPEEVKRLIYSFTNQYSNYDEILESVDYLHDIVHKYDATRSQNGVSDSPR